MVPPLAAREHELSVFLGVCPRSGETRIRSVCYVATDRLSSRAERRCEPGALELAWRASRAALFWFGFC